MTIIARSAACQNSASTALAKNTAPRKGEGSDYQLNPNAVPSVVWGSYDHAYVG